VEKQVVEGGKIVRPKGWGLVGKNGHKEQGKKIGKSQPSFPGEQLKRRGN